MPRNSTVSAGATYANGLMGAGKSVWASVMSVTPVHRALGRHEIEEADDVGAGLDRAGAGRRGHELEAEGPVRARAA